MADQPGNGAASEQASAPQVNALAQYMKDFSFENPNAPMSLQPQSQAPAISIQVNVNARQLPGGEYEVSLMLEGSAGEGASTLFKFDLNYCGLLRLVNVPQEHVHPVVMIEGPRLLFPFVRQIVAEAVRNGGFPPLYIEPVDFAALYRQRISELAQGQTAGAA
ncbi:MAG: protein-export chaperone SecB [Hyphomicrobiales bacterium]|nr:protein-export chaperone SecB [Hyphomicrobiales bacterium]MDE2018141.1 protein-export chaperone SecB [Hyphomicrobiales bacterium]